MKALSKEGKKLKRMFVFSIKEKKRMETLLFIDVTFSLRLQLSAVKHEYP